MDSTNDTTNTNVGTSKYNPTKNNDTHKPEHQLQVIKYPKPLCGGNLFQIFSLIDSKIVSVVTKRVTLNAARAKIM